jgi:hydrogenase 3 maturation protease
VSTIISGLSEWLKGSKILVILGVGNPMRGDDSLGLEMIKRLKNKVPKNIKLIECGSVPENYTSKIKQFNPTHVLIIDAIHANMEPGAVCITQLENIDESFTSTHTLSLRFLSKYLEKTLNVKTLLLGVQVEKLSLESGVSPKIRKAIDDVSEILIRLFTETFK